MPAARDLIERFRPVGTPGPAAPSGVPADRSAALAAELAPVLAALEPTQVQCAAIRAAGRARADRVRAQAAARAAAIASDARRRAEAERAEAAARERRRQDALAAAELAKAERDAERLERQAAERLSDLVSRVVAQARRTLPAATPPDAGGPAASGGAS